MCRRRIANSRSPVLLVHGDDDRNVPFQQTTDLVEKLRAQNVAFAAIGTLSDEQAAHTAGQLRARHEAPARFAACHFQQISQGCEFTNREVDTLVPSPCSPVSVRRGEPRRRRIDKALNPLRA